LSVDTNVVLVEERKVELAKVLGGWRFCFDDHVDAVHDNVLASELRVVRMRFKDISGACRS
jgi:hypothetical protein